MAFLTRSLSRPIVATQRVLKRRDFERLVFADATVSHAQAEAAAIVEAAHARALAVVEEARQQGMRDGQTEIAERLAALAARQSELLQLSLPLMGKLVGEALSSIANEIDQELYIERALRRMRQQLQDVTWLRLQVAPGNAAAARRALAQSDLVREIGLSTDVIENASIDKDEYVFETDLGFATARVSEQVDLLRRVCVAALEHGVRAVLANSSTPNNGGEA